MLLLYKYVDSISCSAMYWMDEAGKLGLQTLLAVNPIIIIMHNKKIKKTATRMLKFTNNVQPGNP